MEVVLQSATPVVLNIFDEMVKPTAFIFKGVQRELEQKQMDIVDFCERMRNFNITSSLLCVVLDF